MSIESSKNRLIDALKNSKEYITYTESRQLISEQEGLLEELMEIRKRTMELYSTHAEDILERSDELAHRMDELCVLPGVISFLEAEEELFRILRTLDREIVGSLRIITP